MTPALPFRPAPFRPARWAPGPHLQTLLGRVLRSPRGPEYRRERLQTPDGDFLDLDWAPEPRAGAPVALVLHGLEGTSHRRYVRNVCRELLARGVWAVALNFRGCSGEMNRLPRFYHSGETSDTRWVAGRIRERLGDRPLGAMGFSLGGNVLLKLLGEDGAAAPFRAAAAMSVPYDLAAGCRLLDAGGVGPLYTRYFMRKLHRKVRAKRALLTGVLDVDAVLRTHTLREFDDAATAPLHGFRDADHYYSESSSGPFLGSVRRPTLLLHARDDPFLPREAIPEEAMRTNPWLVPALTEGGGHVGFLGGTLRRPGFWGDAEAARFLAEALGAADPV